MEPIDHPTSPIRSFRCADLCGPALARLGNGSRYRAWDDTIGAAEALFSPPPDVDGTQLLPLRLAPRRLRGCGPQRGTGPRVVVATNCCIIGTAFPPKAGGPDRPDPPTPRGRDRTFPHDVDESLDSGRGAWLRCGRLFWDAPEDNRRAPATSKRPPIFEYRSMRSAHAAERLPRCAVCSDKSTKASKRSPTVSICSTTKSSVCSSGN